MFKQKIILVDEAPEHGCFMSTRVEEVLRGRSGFIDLRAFFRQFEKEWLADVHASHMCISKRLAKISASWWFAWPTRLDLRPMAFEAYFTPYLIARTAIEWLDRHQDVEQLYVVDDGTVFPANFPKVSEGLEIVDCRRSAEDDEGECSDGCAGWLARASVFTASLKMFGRLVLRHALRREPRAIHSKTVVALTNVFGLPLERTLEYFFTDILNEVPAQGFAVALTGVAESGRRRNLAIDGHRTFFLLDFLSCSDVLKAYVHEIIARWMLRDLTRTEVSCRVGGWVFPNIWNGYYAKFRGKELVFANVAAFFAAKKMTRKNEIRKFVYPYEEKPVERALIRAARANSSLCRSEIWGFMVHHATNHEELATLSRYLG